ncbi:ABC-type transport system involved in multi-copper enzyme maturation, permease component [Actinoplanes cyaneus]|nr:ABC-type transport system involved in multi-copper enzyme maturation, permease component [Actinoplanes cyaneus]
MAALTLREAARRRVLRSLALLTVVLLGLSAWGFSRIEAEFGDFTSGESKVVASVILNLVMFGLSLIAALGSAFLAGPTLAGEAESGVALALLARPVPRFAVLLGKWLGLVGFAGGFVAVAGFAQLLIVYATIGYWPPSPFTGLVFLAAQAVALLTLGLLLSAVISPMASGITAVGLFGATWIAGVVGMVGHSLGNESVARVGTVSRVLLPTDGLWHGAMYALQDATIPAQLGPRFDAPPFLSQTGLTTAYVVWAALWTGLALMLAALAFQRRDL